MDPSKPPGSRLEMLRDLLNDKSLMNKFITEDSLINGPFTSLQKTGSNPHPYGLPTVDSNQENRVTNQQGTSNGLPETSTGRSDNGVSDPQSRPLSANNSLDQQKSEQGQNGHQHGFRAVNQPQRASRSNSKSSNKRSYKKAPPVAGPEVRVTKPNKSRPPRKAPTSLKKPTEPVLQAIDFETEADPTSEQPDDPANPRRFVVGLDFGTTTTAVSYFVHPVDEPSPMVFPDDVKSIMNWPNDDTNGYMYGLMKQVPTQSWYSPFQKRRKPLPDQFDSSGFDISSSESLDSSDDDDEDIEKGEYYDESPQSGPTTLKPMHHATNHNPDASTCELEDNECDEFGHYLWGYEVPNARYLENITRDPYLRLERMKSMLVRSEYLHDDRLTLRARLDFLIDKQLIRKYGKKEVPIPRDVQDAISDFLTQVLKHTGQQLTIHEGLTSQCPISFVATVPVIWSPLASRVLQYSMEYAIKNSGFGTTLGRGSIDNLYITTEPQAAATYLLASSRGSILPGDTIIVLDCGGGTVDASTHEVNDSTPLTLKKQVGQPNGDNCGGTYLNDRYAKRLSLRLRDEHYLDCNGQTREKIVNGFIQAFETSHKRRKNVYERPTLRLPIPGLKGDKERGLSGKSAKRFEENVMNLNLDDFQYVFMPILERVGKVLRKQLEITLDKRKIPKKVFVVGGFGQCPSLLSYLREFLHDFAEETCLPGGIALVEPVNHHDSSTTVTCGSVLDHLNLNVGHAQHRLAYSSFGFLRNEPHEPDICRPHEAATPFQDKCDGQLYVRVIDYFMIKNKTISRKHTFKPLRSIHAFTLSSEKLICEEVVFVNDFETESHYTVGHPKNRYAQVSDKIKIDMTYLKPQNKIQPIYPEPDEDGIVHGKPHYRVEFDLFPIAEDRNLRYEARDIDTGEVLKQGQISIAAAFSPGTF